MNASTQPNRSSLWTLGAALLACLMGVLLAGCRSDAQESAAYVEGAAARAIAASPDCRLLAFVMERRNNSGEAASIQALNLKSRPRTPPIALTFEILEVVEGPDPSIVAFIVKKPCGGENAQDAYQIYMIDKTGRLGEDMPSYWDPETPLLIDGASWSGNGPAPPVKDLLISEDGRYLSVQKNLPETSRPNRRIIVKAKRAQPDGIRPRIHHRSRIGAGDSPSEKAPSRWLPPKKPAQLPAFLAARQPEVHAETQPVWSFDTQEFFHTIYVHDKEGVWSADIVPPFPEWRLILPRKHVRALQASSDGSHALLERGDQKRQVELISLKADQPARVVGEGRMARFSPDGKRFAYLSNNRAFIADIHDAVPDALPVGFRPHPNIQPYSLLQWSDDSRLLYVHDAKGIWRINPDEKQSGWRLFVKAEGVHTYRIARRENRLRAVVGNKTPTAFPYNTILYVEMEAEPALAVLNDNGRFDSRTLSKIQLSILRGNLKNGASTRIGERAIPKERHIVSVSLTEENPELRYIGRGWDAGFNQSEYIWPFHSDTSCLYYANFKGMEMAISEGGCGTFKRIKYNE